MLRLALLSSLATAALLLSLAFCNAEGWSATTDVEQLNDGLIAYSTEDYSLAFVLLQPLAEKDVPLAQLLFGRLFAIGYGTAQNCELAVRWLVRAAQRGNAEAAYDLASFSEQGACLPPNASQALVWYQLAAANGDTRAPNAIGEIYLGRADVAPDLQKAAFWFGRGVTLFDATAYYHLGEMYATGHGVPKDFIEAYKWFDLAADLDIPDQVSEITKGAVARDKIREELMPAQVLEGKKRASGFLNQFISPKDNSTFSQTASEPFTFHRN
jgi:TPR repeat protein